MPEQSVGRKPAQHISDDPDLPAWCSRLRSIYVGCVREHSATTFPSCQISGAAQVWLLRTSKPVGCRNGDLSGTTRVQSACHNVCGFAWRILPTARHFDVAPALIGRFGRSHGCGYELPNAVQGRLRPFCADLDNGGLVELPERDRSRAVLRSCAVTFSTATNFKWERPASGIALIISVYCVCNVNPVHRRFTHRAR